MTNQSEQAKGLETAESIMRKYALSQERALTMNYRADEVLEMMEEYAGVYFDQQQQSQPDKELERLQSEITDLFHDVEQLTIQRNQLLGQSQPGIKQWVSEWIDVKDRLPELNQRILISEYEECLVTIANYKIDKVWGDKKGNPCFVDEQDEQPGRCYPTHWKEIDTPNSTPTPQSDKKLVSEPVVGEIFNRIMDRAVRYLSLSENKEISSRDYVSEFEYDDLIVPESDMVSKERVLDLVQSFIVGTIGIQECITKIKEL
jgi:hypothetical protein